MISSTQSPATPNKTRASRGLSLIEVIFAITLSAAIAVAGFTLLRQPGTEAKATTCQAHRETLMVHAENYQRDTLRQPGRRMTELQTTEYAGATLPVCPTSGQAFQFVGGRVTCPTHP
ncbi:MAG: hypothetical protein AAGA03_07915 [Planctomycetota bacterium]